MKTRRAFALVLILVAAIASTLLAAETVLFREDFNSLDNWRPLTVANIERHTKYVIEEHGEERYLKAESDASASAIARNGLFDVYRHPKVRWRWKIGNIYKKAAPGRKEGDDYPIRIYVVFPYDPGRLGFLEKIKYNAAKVMYGEYPPDSSLTYVWASGEVPARIMQSPYTERARIIVLEKGAAEVGIWKEEAIDILEDYRKAFGSDPPPNATITIMNDSDNTGERSVSYVDYIEVYR